jgi:hypothetical protein
MATFPWDIRRENVLTYCSFVYYTYFPPSQFYRVVCVVLFNATGASKNATELTDMPLNIAIQREIQNLAVNSVALMGVKN